MKVCLVCFGFKKANIRLQPWRYIYEISRRMSNFGIVVEIITDGYPTLPRKEGLDGITIYRLRQLRSIPFRRNRELIDLFGNESPDVILWSIGNTSFYFLRTLREINKPIIGLWMGTSYNLMKILHLGFGEMIRNFKLIYIYLIGLLMPSFLIEKVLRLPSLKGIIVLNENSKRELIGYGFSPYNIYVIPPGITKDDLEIPKTDEIEKLRKELELDKNTFVVLYIGSPLSLRGTDTLIDAISLNYKKIPDLKLVFLSRRGATDLCKEENYIKKLCKAHGIDDSIKIISGFLDRNDVKKFILLSDVIALPFKLVQADTPISILEVMALGKPLISTKVDGIPDLLKDGLGYLINPNDPKELAYSIFILYSNPKLRKDMGELARENMLKYPTWDQINETVISLIYNLLNQKK